MGGIAYNWGMYKKCHLGHERSPENLYPDGHCKECDRTRSRAVDNPIYRTAAKTARDLKRENMGSANTQQAVYLMYKYKMTGLEYDEQLTRQGGGCAICGRTSEANSYRLAVDHDHKCCTGLLTCGKCRRGILCSACNSRIEWLITNDNAIQRYRTQWGA